MSAGDKPDIQLKSSETTCPDIMSENASAALTSLDSQLQINVNEASEGQPGTVPVAHCSSSNATVIAEVPQTFSDEHSSLKSAADNTVTKCN